MSRKNEIVKELHILEEEMKLLESKRSRSMAVILEALVSRVEPDAQELQYFRTYTAEIDIKREQLQKLTKELESSFM